MKLRAGTILTEVRRYPELTRFWHEQGPQVNRADGGAQLVKLHAFNYAIWHHEDEVRREGVSLVAIAARKRAIDQLNARRNELIEKIDRYVLAGVPDAPNARLTVETVGFLADRLSIAALRAYHISNPVDRDGAAARLNVVLEQADDLHESLITLLDDVASGRRRFRVYRQFKSALPSMPCHAAIEELPYDKLAY